MPVNVQSYTLQISCPSDIIQFIPLINEAIDSFNRCFGTQNNIYIRTSHWSADNYIIANDNQSPEDQIVNQMVQKSDILVGVFWARYGTETTNYGSGTEEEINKMIEAKKPVFLFFLDLPIKPSEISPDQLRKLQNYKEKQIATKRGVFTLENENELALKLREQLEFWFMDALKHDNVHINSSQEYTKKILWVDDHPENNTYGRVAFERSGIEVINATSTKQALDWLKITPVSVIISDMGRKEGLREGYVLLDMLRKAGNKTPFIIFAGSREKEHIRETFRRGGQGCTNDFEELLSMVKSILLSNYIPEDKPTNEH